jgi:hypothetical protein
MNQITYELHKHDWYLCVDGRRCAKLLSPFCQAQVERAITAQAQAAGDVAVHVVLRLLEQETTASLKLIEGSGVDPVGVLSSQELDELDNYVTLLEVRP